MIRGALAGLALAVVVASGAAWGQERPSHDEALAAVSGGACERNETERYVRFHCEEGEALWYFTRDGRPEHPGYFVAPAYPMRTSNPFLFVPEEMRRALIAGTWGKSSTPNQQDFFAWSREIRDVAEADAIEIQSRRPKRDGGKLYPLEPS